MSLLKLFKPKSHEDLEAEGDTLSSTGLWGNAKVAYERALSRLEKKDPGNEVAGLRLREKIGGTRESLAQEHMENAEELIAGGYCKEAADLLCLAQELTQNTDLKNELQQKNLHLEKLLTTNVDLTGAVDDFDEDIFQDDIADDDEHFFALCASLPDEIQMTYMGYGPNFKSGYLALNAGDFESAAQHLSLAWEENENRDTFIPLELATAYLNLGEGERAGQLLVPFLESHPETLPAYQLMCEIFWESGDFQHATDLLSSVPEDLKESLAVILLRGETLFQAEEFHEAKSLFDRFLKSYGYNEQITRALARVHEALGQPDEALDIYRNIMDTCRTCHARLDPQIKEKYADLSFDNGNRETGILELYLSLAQEIPGRAKNYYRKVSLIYASQGNRKEAERFKKISDDLIDRGDRTA